MPPAQSATTAGGPRLRAAVVRGIRLPRAALPFAAQRQAVGCASFRPLAAFFPAFFSPGAALAPRQLVGNRSPLRARPLHPHGAEPDVRVLPGVQPEIPGTSAPARAFARPPR